jgi:hypothetical protein
LGRFFSKKEKVRMIYVRAKKLFSITRDDGKNLFIFHQVKGGKDSTMPDGGSSSIMSGLSMNISDIDSNYDTMSISSRINISKVDYGRQKKKYEMTIMM